MLDLKHHIKWYGEPDSPQNDEQSIEKWMNEQGLVYNLIALSQDTRDVDAVMNNKWSGYTLRWPIQQNGSLTKYFFETKVDYMAFVLKFHLRYITN